VAFRRGITEYRISWIPLGGYVKFFGASPQEEVPPEARGQEYYRASVTRRAFTVAAGPAANFLLAVVAYAVIGATGISHPPAQIGDVIAGSAAEAAGFVPGDMVRNIEGKKVESWRDIEKSISKSPGKPLRVTVDRAGRAVELTVTPAEVESMNILGRKVKVGRAGVALGYLPPVIAVTAANSAAAVSGLRTGDEVVAIRYGDKEPRITGFWSVLTALQAAQVAGATEVSIDVRAAKLPRLELDAGVARRTLETGSVDAAAETSAEIRTVTMVTSSWSNDATLTPRAFGAGLGIVDTQLLVGEIAYDAGKSLAPLDRILAWNGTTLPNVFRMRELMMEQRAATVDLKVQRGFEEIEIAVPLHAFDAQLPEGKVTMFALVTSFLGQPKDPAPVVEIYDGLFAAIGYGLRETAKQTGMLFATIGALFTGEVPMKALGGPIMIAKVAGDSARMGWEVFLASMALISINLGLVNLFPIPVLDGGQLVMLSIEGVRRRPLADAAIENFHKVGFAMILALVVLATYNDLSRFWKSMLESVVGKFQ